MFTCEHATNQIPNSYQDLFKNAGPTLRSHRGWDLGVFPVAQEWARFFGAPLISGRFSRLLVDLNRAEQNAGVFSEYTRGLPARELYQLLRTYHRPHWEAVRAMQSKFLKKSSHPQKKLVHIGVHSFTPVYHGYERKTDIGLLFDPARPLEAALARRWQKNLQRMSDFTVHCNRPYLGTGNGIVSESRKIYSPHKYLGFEIELNQKLLDKPRAQKDFAALLALTFPDDGS